MTFTTLRRRFIAHAIVAGLTLGAASFTPAFAYDTNSTAAINVDQQGIGLHGYDPVAYFTQKQPVMGKALYTASHDGATYRFASQEHLDKFKANPAMYAPQFGGFCAMGVSLEKKLDGDPQAWRIVDGKLYLNVNKDVQKKWLEDVPGNLANANKTWPQIKNKAPKDL